LAGGVAHDFNNILSVIQAELPVLRQGTETILLIEDDGFLRAAAQKTLSQSGYRVFTAMNSAEALEVWEQNRDKIDLLLTDLMLLRGMNGMELAKRLLKEKSKTESALRERSQRGSCHQGVGPERRHQLSQQTVSIVETLGNLRRVLDVGK
jgi:CheY-like chemotaxis protein